VVAYLGFAILSLRTSRGIVWFGLVMAPIVAERLTVLVNHYKKAVVQSRDRGGSRIINTVFIAVILLMGLITLPWFKSTLPLPTAKAGLISAETPLQATEVLLDQSPPRRLFNAMSFGSYLIWAAYPEYRVFADSRIELFPEKIWLDYFSISNAEAGWDEKLTAYGVNSLMLSQTEQQPLIKAVVSSDNWYMLYKDNIAAVYVRK
jgi:hypothetical protein